MCFLIQQRMQIAMLIMESEEDGEVCGKLMWSSYGTRSIKFIIIWKRMDSVSLLRKGSNSLKASDSQCDPSPHPHSCYSPQPSASNALVQKECAFPKNHPAFSKEMSDIVSSNSPRVRSERSSPCHLLQISPEGCPAELRHVVVLRRFSSGTEFLKMEVCEAEGIMERVPY